MSSVLGIDLGASSYRVFRVESGETPHGTEVFRALTPSIQKEGFERWDISDLIANLKRIVYEQKEIDSVAVCGWGVDFCLLDENLDLIAEPIRYRDPSHAIAQQEFMSLEWYQKTGIQPWPFNTVCQIKARQIRNDSELMRAKALMLIPDYVASHLCNNKEPFAELTNASTTQMLGADGNWLPQKFDIPLPKLKLPGDLIGGNVRLCASHDTASAFFAVNESELILSSGTWSLIGTHLDDPILNEEAMAEGFTNERSADGRFRFLKNIAGLWLLQQCFQNLTPAEVESIASEVKTPVPTFDVNHPSLTNPANMKSAIKSLVPSQVLTDAELALSIYESLSDAYVKAIGSLTRLTGKSFSQITVVGGGTRQTFLNRLLAEKSGLKVLLGPQEATVLGNAKSQFLSIGAPFDLSKAQLT